MAEKRKIILDCDPGHDDAVAIILAGKNENIDLLGVTVVSGNSSIEKTVLNARRVCSVLDLDVPIAQGMGGPMVRERYLSTDSCGDVHGESGLDGYDFKEPTKNIIEKHGVNFIVDTIMNSDTKVTVVATGPLTNVAMAIKMEPKILDNIDEFVIMGGSNASGNVTASAEFNILADPEAAHIVFDSGVFVTMMGLDVTRLAQCTKPVIDRVKTIDNEVSRMFVGLLEFFTQTQKEVFNWDAPPTHDPTTVAYLIDPSIFKFIECNVQICLERGQNDLVYGRTVCDVNHVSGKKVNARVAIDLDFDKFWDLVYESVKLY